MSIRNELFLETCRADTQQQRAEEAVAIAVHLRAEVRALRRERARLRKALRIAHGAMRSVVAAWNDAEREDDAVAECARALGVTGPALAPKRRRKA